LGQQKKADVPTPVGCNKPYAVYLDEDVAFHSDYLHAHCSPYVSPEKYYRSLNLFFERFERLSGLNIVFAAHPRSQWDTRKDLLQGRAAYTGITADLVRSATFVIAHASTSLSFAALWRKPIIVLTSGEFEESLYRENIHSTAGAFSCPLVNIDDEMLFNKTDIESWSVINEKSYRKYVREFITTIPEQTKSTWEIFSDEIRQMVND